MSAADDDSLLSAIAATPSVVPPTVLTSAIVIDVGREALDEVQAIARTYLGRVAEHPPKALLVRLTSPDCATRAASCVLALRAAFPRAVAAVATNPVEAAAINRAAALMNGADSVRIDEQTAALIDGDFETRAERSELLLIGTRAPSIVLDGSESDGDAHIARAIAEERSLSAERMMTIIVVSIALALLGHLVFPALRGRSTIRWIYVGWLITAVVRWLVVRSRKQNAGAFMHTIYVIDVPAFFTISLLNRGTDPAGEWYMAWCIAIAATLQFFMQVRPILLSAALLIATCSVFCVYSGQAFLAFFAAALIGFPVAIGIYTQARTRALLRRVVAESAERIRHVEAANREVRGLNEELRRQIADRAGQLSAAIARLSVHQTSALAAGSVVEDRYRVLDRIGAGGMGAVYRVERVSDGRRLALKVVTGVADHTALSRFAREAQVAAEIDHPNIVSVVDVDVSRSGMLFLVMELVAGGSLAARHDRYGDVKWALPLLRQVAAAFPAMHARGIVHRDLKPANVLLDGERAKVADFGLAALSEVAPLASTQQVAAVASPALTRTGAIMGTPLYMAPELARGAQAGGPATDVFSFGVVAYELLTKQLPHAAPPVLERLAGRAPTTPRPMAAARADLPGDLASLLDRCLAEDPEQRPSASAIAAAIERAHV